MHNDEMCTESTHSGYSLLSNLVGCLWTASDSVKGHSSAWKVMKTIYLYIVWPNHAHFPKDKMGVWRHYDIVHPAYMYGLVEWCAAHVNARSPNHVTYCLLGMHLSSLFICVWNRAFTCRKCVVCMCLPGGVSEQASSSTLLSGRSGEVGVSKVLLSVQMLCAGCNISEVRRLVHEKYTKRIALVAETSQTALTRKNERILREGKQDSNPDTPDLFRFALVHESLHEPPYFILFYFKH